MTMIFFFYILNFYISIFILKKKKNEWEMKLTVCLSIVFKKHFFYLYK